MIRTPHTLNVATDEAGVHEYWIDCPDPNGDCTGYNECTAAACAPGKLNRVEDGEGGVTLHGVVHHPVAGGDWGVPTGKCYLASWPNLVEAARELDVPRSGGEVAAGKYQVVDDPQSPWRLRLWGSIR